MSDWLRTAQTRQVTILVNGRAVQANEEDSVATALLASGLGSFGINAKTGKPLSPACLMGVCFGCLCTIEGRRGSQACLEPVRDGIVVETEGDPM